MSSAVVCIVKPSIILISFMFGPCSCAPLRQLKCLPPPPRGGYPGGVGDPPLSSPVYSALFWDPFEMLFWSPLVAALGLNAAKSTPKTTQF